MDKAYRTQFVKNTQTAERQRAERQKTVQKHLNYSGMFVLRGGDDGDGNGLDNYSRSGGGGWVVQCSRGGTPKWLLLSFFCCYMTKCAPTKGSLFLLAGWFLMKEWGRPCLFTLAHNQRNDWGRRGHWSLAQQGLRGKKTPWKGACIKM